MTRGQAGVFANHLQEDRDDDVHMLFLYSSIGTIGIEKTQCVGYERIKY